METTDFDALTQSLAKCRSRRGFARLLGALALGVPLAVLPGVLTAGLANESETATRRRRATPQRRAAHRDQLQAQGKRKKKTCAKAGQTPNTKRKRCCRGLAPDGGGVCARSTSAPPPPGCTPATCPPAACGSVPDGCGGTLSCGSCAGTTVCVGGTCQPCDVCDSGCLFSSVQQAVNAASAGEAIRICPGVYTKDLIIQKSLTLIGAGDGNGAGNTILHGSGTASVMTIDVRTTVSLQRLRITGGAGAFQGGGIHNFGTLGLTGCTITGNTATNFGGGILNGGGSLTLTDCTVSGNTASVNGGGIFARSPVELINSRVTGNTADNGGGIIHDGRVTLTGSTVSGNEATDIGGGIVSSGPLELINSSITGNTAGIRGGGIFTSSSGTVTSDAASRVTGNNASPSSPDNGGGVFNNAGTVTLSSADNVTGNTPDNCGGTAVPLCTG